MAVNRTKWNPPTGWHIEQKYSSGVLLSNWFENNLGKFSKGQYPSRSCTNREDYQLYPANTYNPDVSIRRKGLLRNDGLNKDHIFSHHGNWYLDNQISSYDQNYNRKYCLGLREWNLRRIAWLPETSDRPLQGASTNFGLKEDKERPRKESDEHDKDYTTTHGLSYRYHPRDTATKIMATPRHLSSHFHPHNVHKNLHLRGSPLIVRPEFVDPKLLKLSSTL